jgi:uncharacterized membrane protein YeaQ/YmgE (transglycosylase-associated protein family)
MMTGTGSDRAGAFGRLVSLLFLADIATPMRVTSQVAARLSPVVPGGHVHPARRAVAVMALESLFVILLVGALAGWLAGLIVNGYGYGLFGNIVVGIVGTFVAGLILPRLRLSIGPGIAGAIIHATIGAVILLYLTGWSSGRRRRPATTANGPPASAGGLSCIHAQGVRVRPLSVR